MRDANGQTVECEWLAGVPGTEASTSFNTGNRSSDDVRPPSEGEASEWRRAGASPLAPPRRIPALFSLLRRVT